MERTCPRCRGIAKELIPFTGPVNNREDLRLQCESCNETFAVGADGMLFVIDVL
ncbi:MAG TPA: hypothetical protein VIC35_02195 [Acidimicrobiia bacterium]|jgi:hypothetical protein